MNGHRVFRYVAIVAFISCYITILLGGNVMASDSGLACSTWPACNGTIFPPLTGAVGIEWSHRLSALGLALITVSLAVLALVYERSRPILLRLSVIAAITVVAQAMLGGLVVESDLAVVVVLSHFGLATVLFVILLMLAFAANWKALPGRWRKWVEEAGDELPPSERLRRTEPNARPTNPVPSGHPLPPSRAG